MKIISGTCFIVCMLLAHTSCAFLFDEIGSSSWPRHFASPLHQRLQNNYQKPSTGQPQRSQSHPASRQSRAFDSARDSTAVEHSTGFHGASSDAPLEAADGALHRTRPVQYILQIPHGVANDNLKYSFQGHSADGHALVKLYTEPTGTVRRDVFGRLVRHQPKAFAQEYQLPVAVLPESLRLTLHSATQVLLHATAVESAHKSPSHTHADHDSFSAPPPAAPTPAVPPSRPPSPLHQALEKAGVTLPLDVKHVPAPAITPLDWGNVQDVDVPPPVRRGSSQPDGGAYDGYEYRGEWHEY